MSARSFVVGEVVGRLREGELAYEAASDELLQAVRRLLVAAAARGTDAVGIERAADHRGGLEQLVGHRAQSGQARLEQVAQLARKRFLSRLASRGDRREVLGDEERQALALDVDPPLELPRRLRLDGPHEQRDLALVEAREAHQRCGSGARQLGCEPAQPMTGRHALGPPGEGEHERPFA